MMLQMIIFQINEIELSIHQRSLIRKMAHNCFQDYNNNNECFFEHHVRMISEGSCDTED